MSRDALVVGINTYQYLPSLKAPARDAEAIAQQLHTYGEFRVQRLPEVIQAGKPQVGQKTQITLRELETALINLFKPKGSSVPQTAVFYFSGHGIQREAGIREGYLALSDSNPDKGFFGLSLFWLRRLLQESPVRQRIILLDCCHSGELLNFLEADPGAHPGTDRLFMAASREYETAYESLESPYSVFTDALVTGLDPNRLASGIVTNHSLTDWVNHTLKGEIQQPLFESSGSEIILTRQNSNAESIPSPAAAAQSKDICPYRGLEVFDEAHAEYFFGREDLTAQLLQKLSKKQFVAVVGASGSGKSSLVRAGLIAQLRQGKKVAGSDQWKIKLITPTHQPLKSLAAAFIDPESSDLERAEQLRRAETFLQDGGAGLAQLIRASLPITPNTTGLPTAHRPRFLLVVDQFEEVFTLSHGSQAERERQEFFDCLVGALIAAQEVFSVVIALRADFLNKCSNYEGLTQQISQNHVMVAPLKYEQIKATIVKPAQKVGLVCEPNLVYTMMADIIGAPGELPLLQYTLSELWQRRRVGTGGGVSRLTLDAYQGLGGVRGTLQKRATEVFHSLSAEEQTVARRIFLALTQLGEGTEDTRRRVVKSELVSPISPMGLVNQVLEKLVAAKLVMTSQESTEISELAASEGASGGLSILAKPFSQEIVDVAHEALIRNWSLLRTWLDESREMLRRQRRIEQAAQEWHHVGQPTSGEYLLYGFRLRDAEDFLKQHPQELSDLAHQYIDVSYANCRRARRRSQRLQVAIPSVLVATLTIVLNQYYSTLRTRSEQDNQLQKAMVRERAAIVQAVLKDAKADPMTALLISRLAAESGDTSYEAQSSLRAALQNLRLQSELQGHEGAVSQVVFSPDRRHLATAGADGKIHLWAVNPGTIYNTRFAAEKVLSWTEADQPAANPSAVNPPGKQQMIRSVVFSPDGRQIAATTENSSIVKVWSVESGKLSYQLIGSAAATSAVKQISYSPNGEWLATLGEDQSISVWQAETGTLKARLQGSSAIHHLEFSLDGKEMLLSGEDGTAQLQQLAVDASGTLNFKQEKAFIHSTAVDQAKFGANLPGTGNPWIVTLSKDGKVRVWDRQTGKVQRTFPELARPEVSRGAARQSVEGSTGLPIKQMWFSPDQRTLATLTSNHQVSLWNLQSGQLQAKLVSEDSSGPAGDSSDAVERLEFSPNGRMVVTTPPATKGEGHTAYLWDSQTGRRIGQLSGHQSQITAVQFSLDGTYVVTASADGKVRLWATELGGELPAVHLGNDAVEWISFLPSLQQPNSTAETASSNSPQASKRLSAAIADAGAINTHLSTDQASGLDLDLSQANQSGQLMQTATDRQGKAGETAVTQMLAVGAGGQLQRWQILTDPPTQSAMLSVNSAAPAKSDHYLAAIRPQAIANLKDRLITLTQTRGLNWRNAVPSVMPGFANVPQLPLLQTFSQSGQSISLPNHFEVPETEALSGFATSPDGKLFATADIQGWVRVYQIQADQPPQLLHQVRNWRRVKGQTHPVSVVDRETNQEPVLQLANNAVPSTQSHQQSHQVMSSAKTLGTGDPVAIRHLTFSPDGKQILGIADDLTMRSWEATSGKLIQVFQGHEASIRQVRYSPDGQWIVSASWDRTARIWQTATGQITRTLTHEDAVSSASFSPDGRQVVTTSWNGTAQIWQLGKNKPQVLLNQHQKSVLDAQFSPDGRLLVTASLDGTARLWNAATGEEQSQLRPQGGEGVLQAAFSPDGQYVATLTKSGKVHLWGATWEMLLQLARERSSRQLTIEECSQYLRLPADQCPQLPEQN
jgi:WD40 repeat protein/energy-coupling factor transporter ATP-binding protein EcfA2